MHKNYFLICILSLLVNSLKYFRELNLRMFFSLVEEVKNKNKGS